MENNQKSSLVLETTYQVFEIQLNLHVFFFYRKKLRLSVTFRGCTKCAASTW